MREGRGGRPCKGPAASSEPATDAVKLKSEQVLIPTAGGQMEEMMEEGLMVLEPCLELAQPVKYPGKRRSQQETAGKLRQSCFETMG